MPFGKPFSVTQIPAHALEAQWKGSENPMEKSFASLMLGVARGFDAGMEPPFEKFPMQLTTPREFVRRMGAERLNAAIPTERISP